MVTQKNHIINILQILFVIGDLEPTKFTWLNWKFHVFSVLNFYYWIILLINYMTYISLASVSSYNSAYRFSKFFREPYIFLVFRWSIGSGPHRYIAPCAVAFRDSRLNPLFRWGISLSISLKRTMTYDPKLIIILIFLEEEYLMFPQYGD